MARPLPWSSQPMSGSPITRHVRTLTAVAGVVTILGAASARAQGQAIDPKWLVQSVASAIPRAFTLNLDQGLVSEATDTIRFTAQPAGDYLIFCGVPGHGAAGMWIRFQVSASATAPALRLTPARPTR